MFIVEYTKMPDLGYMHDEYNYAAVIAQHYDSVLIFFITSHAVMIITSIIHICFLYTRMHAYIHACIHTYMHTYNSL